ncbi:MAG: hypothetical protein Q4G39_01940 [Brachymonas sp.]|nr:hypothetical protein [Brachymonas sp.]
MNMSRTLSLLLLPAVLLGCAQTPVATSGAAPASPQSTETVVENEKGKPVKHITHSDAGSTINEVREGADTKSVTVKPAYNAPRYDIVPDARSGQPGNYGNQGGKRVWRVLSF